MAIARTSLYEKIQTKQEEAINIDNQLTRLEDDIRKLKINFGIYFNGGISRPPLEQRARLEAIVKRISDDRTLTFQQRYRFNTLVSRFVSYRELWRRLLKKRELELD